MKNYISLLPCEIEFSISENSVALRILRSNIEYSKELVTLPGLKRGMAQIVRTVPL